MDKIVVFSLLAGSLNHGFPAVTAQVWDHNRLYPMKLTGSLPPIPELPELYRRWNLLYKALHQRLVWQPRIKIYAADVTNVSISEFGELSQQLQDTINKWLNSEPLQNLVQQLRTILNTDEAIRVIFETNIHLLQRLPWHLWNFFDDYRHAEVALAPHEYVSPPSQPKLPTGKVKILAILGNSDGIDVSQDRELLQKLKDAETVFLVEPTSREVNQQLWNHDWDILFFAGHSASENDGETGKIYINPTESLAVSQLKNALRQAIATGLKVAIFNSCDGIGLARDLADLHIPQVIVMREPVPDLVAQEFLKNFLVAFAGGKSLYSAVREARERLQGWENDFPCASWLPVICQNPTTQPVTWQELCGIPHSHRKYQIWQQTITSCLVTSAVSALIMGLRYLGVWQIPELQTYDHLLRLRPPEGQDSRLLIVEVNEKDIQTLLEPRRGVKSISDASLAKLLKKLQQYQPRIIGIDIYRDVPDSLDQRKQLELTTQLNQENVVVICKGKDSQYDPQGTDPPAGVPVDRQGFTDGVRDRDGVVRRQILMMRQESSSGCTTPYSLSLQLAARYLFGENIQPDLTDDAVIFKSVSGETKFPRLKLGRSGAYQQGTSLGGVQIPINYRNANFERVSVQDVLSDRVKSEAIKDKIILIGVVAQSFRIDAFPTPYSISHQVNQETPGVVIQAHMTSQIISAVLDKRPVFWVLPYWGDILWIWGWGLFSGLVVLSVRSRLAKICSIGITIIVLYGICTVIFFIKGAWLPLVPSTFAIVLASGTVLVVKPNIDLGNTKKQII